MEKTWVDGPLVTTNLFDHLVAQRDIPNLPLFLEPKWPDHIHDPFLLPDMDKAVARIWQAVQKGEGIGIVGDYDMDGTPAAALLADFFQTVGIHPHVLLPTREEGYGFSTAFVERFSALGVSLIITVDTGIRDTTSVALANEKGIDVIVTDHHDCPEVLPEALAVINPKRIDSRYPFRELSGTGVAYKLASALIAQRPQAYVTTVNEGWLAWSLDLVAMATVSDMVPLIDENRVLVTFGMKVLRKTRRVGLQRFLAAIDVMPESLSYSDIAFKIAPKFNASGRMESMDDVFVLLSTNDPALADAAVARVLGRATQSQQMMAQMMEEAKAAVVGQEHASVILIGNPEWHPGLTGLVAGRLVEEYQRPVGVFAGAGGRYRGSMRSVPGIALPPLLESASHLLDKFGGHEQAAGLSFPHENLVALQTHAEQFAFSVVEIAQKQTDGTITPDHVTLETLEACEALAPWGMANSEPLWSLKNVRLADVKWLSEGQHLKAVVRGLQSDLPIIYFRAQSALPIVGETLDMHGSLAINEFRGRKTPQLIVRGISLASQSE